MDQCCNMAFVQEQLFGTATVSGDWILATGFWDDGGSWIDGDSWID